MLTTRHRTGEVMNTVHGQEESDIVRLQSAARDVLLKALGENGYLDARSVYMAMKKRHSEGTTAAVVPARSIARYMREGPPVAPRGGTYASFSALGQLVDVQEELLGACRQLWSRNRQRDDDGARDVDSVRPAPRGPTESWYQIIPAQDGRPYASIDIVEIDRISNDEFEGTIERVSPPHERSYHWTVSGTTYGTAAIFASFFPWEQDNVISRGAMMLQWKGYRVLRYEGTYWRLSDDGARRMERSLVWERDVMQTALHDVALLDLDNTLRVGWSLRPWLAFLSRNGIEQADACIGSTNALFEEYLTSNHADHDALAISCAQAYAEMAKGISVTEMDEAGATFVNNYDATNVHDFVSPLVEYLKARKIAPVIVSGAPLELVKHHAARLGVEQYFGLKLAVNEHGCFDGGIEKNPGVAAEKRNVVREIKNLGRVATLAVGDSESDLPLWDAAPNKIVVGSRAPEPEWPSDKTLRVDPSNSSWNQIQEWLDANVLTAGLRNLPT
jgi:HAD superfamily phosphoserine phosphatase-like hydrolase